MESSGDVVPVEVPVGGAPVMAHSLFCDHYCTYTLSVGMSALMSYALGKSHSAVLPMAEGTLNSPVCNECSARCPDMECGLPVAATAGVANALGTEIARCGAEALFHVIVLILCDHCGVLLLTWSDCPVETGCPNTGLIVTASSLCGPVSDFVSVVDCLAKAG